jgi:hypothetical protein
LVLHLALERLLVLAPHVLVFGGQVDGIQGWRRIAGKGIFRCECSRESIVDERLLANTDACSWVDLVGLLLVPSLPFLHLGDTVDSKQADWAVVFAAEMFEKVDADVAEEVFGSRR